MSDEMIFCDFPWIISDEIIFSVSGEINEQLL